MFFARMNATGKKSQHRTYYTDLDVLEKVKRVIMGKQINMNNFKMKFLKVLEFTIMQK